MTTTRYFKMIGGAVLGNMWGGGRGYYQARRIAGEYEHAGEIEQKALDMLADGSLDSGMGFDGLVGAVLDIEEIERTSEGHEKSIGVDTIAITPHTSDAAGDKKLRSSMLDYAAEAMMQ